MNLKEITQFATDFNKQTEESLVKVKSYDIDTKIAETVNAAGEAEEYRLNEASESQLFGMLKINSPIKYISGNFEVNSAQKSLSISTHATPQKVIDSLIELGIRHKQKQHRRFIYDKRNRHVKAVTGQAYNRIPNIDVINLAAEVYGKEIDPRFSYINEREMKIFFKSNELQVAPKSQEKVLYGYSIGNSELGYASLSIQKGVIFLRCSNGLILTKLMKNVSIRHTLETIEEEYKYSLKYFEHDTTILDMIDGWVARPAIMNRRELLSQKGMNSIREKLNTYGIHNDDDIVEIIDLLQTNQTEENKINNYWIGNAVTDYASNHLENPSKSNMLLMNAYQLMTAI